MRAKEEQIAQSQDHPGNLEGRERKKALAPKGAKALILLGAPGKIRTPDLLIRSQTLYPAELPAQREISLSLKFVFLSRPLFGPDEIDQGEAVPWMLKGVGIRIQAEQPPFEDNLFPFADDDLSGGIARLV